MLLCCLRRTLKPSASASCISKLYQHFRERGLPYGLQDSLPTLNPSCSLLNFLSNSAMGPRLDTGGWLTLTESHCCLSSPTGTFTLQDTPSLPRRDNESLRGFWSSSPREPPPQALTEPYVNLSIHTALIIQSSNTNANAQIGLGWLSAPTGAI